MSIFLSERMRQILQMVIEDYILTAEPVGSRTISRKSNLGSKSGHHPKYYVGFRRAGTSLPTLHFGGQSSYRKGISYSMSIRFSMSMN